MEISVHPAVPVQQGDDRAQRDALIQEVRAAIERDLNLNVWLNFTFNRLSRQNVFE